MTTNDILTYCKYFEQLWRPCIYEKAKKILREQVDCTPEEYEETVEEIARILGVPPGERTL